ncbi:MAG: AAA family ATPase [Euryarchaeota archaeon]
MKLGIVGKGGVGKTTIAATLAKLLAERGHEVLAVDADPDPDLAYSMGLDEPPTPIVEREGLIRERTGAPPGATFGPLFRVNPRVSDLPDRLAVEVEPGLRLLVVGRVEDAGEGCFCPAAALARRLIRHVVADRGEAIVVDTDAGLEHFGRRVLEAVDWIVIVCEPSVKSFKNARESARLARRLGVDRLALVRNKWVEGVEGPNVDADVTVTVPESPGLRRLELRGRPVWEDETVRSACEELLDGMHEA